MLKTVFYLAGLHWSHYVVEKYQRDKKSCKAIICVQADMLQKDGQEKKVGFSLIFNTIWKQMST